MLIWPGRTHDNNIILQFLIRSIRASPPPSFLASPPPITYNFTLSLTTTYLLCRLSQIEQQVR